MLFEKLKNSLIWLIGLEIDEVRLLFGKGACLNFVIGKEGLLNSSESFLAFFDKHIARLHRRFTIHTLCTFRNEESQHVKNILVYAKDIYAIYIQKQLYLLAVSSYRLFGDVTSW